MTSEPTPNVAETAEALRRRTAALSGAPRRVVAALKQAGTIWRHRLENGWEPLEGSPFPFVQVRRSLEPLIPGLETADKWQARLIGDCIPERGTGRVAALVLAGNTPLMAWSPLCACLLAGWAVYAKMSRDETLWPRLFVDVLREADPEVADLVHLDVWPGDDPRTADLVQATDAVVAYGSDATLAALRESTPPATPFFGHGHAVSIGLTVGEHWENNYNASGFAHDVLMYEQGGCLSAQAVLFGANRERLLPFARALQQACGVASFGLPVPADPAQTRLIREARDMALFDSATVYGDDELRWTVIVHPQPRPMSTPTGFGVVEIIPIDAPENFAAYLGPVRGCVSCVGIAGEITPALREALAREGVSRICKPGEMQTPPLDWPNGNRDLLVELASIGRP